MRFDAYPYDALVSVYDELAAVYSFGRIRLSKLAQLEVIAPGDRVLYAGVGRGEDALLAARFGAKVTAIDLAPAMLVRLEKKLAREGLGAELIEGDVWAHRPAQAYDAVVANYFLDLFDLPTARRMLEHLTQLVAPEGLMLIADFARPVGGPVGRAISELHYRPLNWLAAALGFCALHPIFDFERLLEPLGFRVRSARRWPLLVGENPAYVSLVAERAEATPV